MSNAYVATQDAVVNTPEGPAYLKKGVTRVVEGHRMLKDHPEFFQPADEDAHFGAPETTRQEPEVPRSRHASGEAKKTAAKKADSGKGSD